MLESDIDRFGGQKEDFKKDRANEEGSGYPEENIVSKSSGETKLGPARIGDGDWGEAIAVDTEQ